MRVNSVVDGHTNYLISLFILGEKRRERFKNTEARDVTNTQQRKERNGSDGDKKAAEQRGQNRSVV